MIVGFDHDDPSIFDLMPKFLAEAHIAGRSDHSRLIWQLLMLERSLARLGAA